MAGRDRVLQGTLDMLILRTLIFGPAHGHQIARHIQRTTDAVLQLEHGTLYPALHRLERRGLLSAKWEAPNGQQREFRFYRLTAAGRRHLAAEQSKWRRLVRAIGLVMTRPVEN